MAIESDVTNPDSRLAVRFYSKPLKNEFESAKEGRPIHYDVDMITIYVPGDNTLTVDAEVREDHKQRFPLQWAHYQNKHGDDPRNVGTPVSQWPLITPAMAEDLRALKFYTVESIAAASDSQLQNIGMKAGMNALVFRTRAQNYLKVAKDEASMTAQTDEIAALKAENASIKADTDAKLAAMQEQMAQILAAVGQKTEQKKAGRPKSVQVSDEPSGEEAEEV